MARKKKGGAKKTISKKHKTAKKPRQLRKRINLAWKNLILFLILLIFSYIFYGFSSTSLLKNFFGIISIIFGFLAFAFLISFIVLLLLEKSRK